MKQHFERYGIYYLIGAVILIGIVVCFAAYRPNVGTDISDTNADWVNFGVFFVGFGTMCFTLLNVIAYYVISQRNYRREFYAAYRNALNKFIDAFLITQNKNNSDCEKTNSTEIEFSKSIKASMIIMIGILGGISISPAFSKEVANYAGQLHDKCSELINQSTADDFIQVINDLSGFQVCLLINKVNPSKRI